LTKLEKGWLVLVAESTFPLGQQHNNFGDLLPEHATRGAQAEDRDLCPRPPTARVSEVGLQLQVGRLPGQLQEPGTAADHREVSEIWQCLIQTSGRCQAVTVCF